MSWTNYNNPLKFGDQVYTEGLGMACNLGNNKCRGFDLQPGIANSTGTGNLRHYKERDTGPCYEFCANTQDAYSPVFQGTIGATRNPGVFSDNDPTIAFPQDLGSHNEFAQCCESDFSKGPCNKSSGNVNYDTVVFDYTKHWWASRPGSCDVDNHATVLKNMRIPQTGAVVPAKDLCNADKSICTYPDYFNVKQYCPASDSCIQWNPVNWESDPGTNQTYSCLTAEAMKPLMFTRASDGQCQLNASGCGGQSADILTDRCVEPVCNDGKLECKTCADGFKINVSKQGTDGVCQWTNDRDYWTQHLGGTCNGADTACKNGATPQCQVVNNVTTPAHWMLSSGLMAIVHGGIELNYLEGETEWNTREITEKSLDTLSEGLIHEYGAAAERRYGFEQCGINTTKLPITYSRQGLVDLDVSGWGAIADRSWNHPGGGAMLTTIPADPDQASRDLIYKTCKMNSGWTNQTGVFDVSECDADQKTGTGSRCIQDGLYLPRIGDYGQKIEGRCPTGLLPWTDEEGTIATGETCVPGQTIRFEGSAGYEQCGFRSGVECTEWGPAFAYADTPAQTGLITQKAPGGTYT
jgi:hypothetical protein